LIPKFYDEDYMKNATLTHGNQSYNGYGFLNTCQKCIVEENTNGNYTLEMELLTSDKFAEYVLPNTFIKVIPNKIHNPQLFQVYRVKENGNKISVSANHIKYLALNNMISCYNVYKDSQTGISLVVPENYIGTAKDTLIHMDKTNDRLYLFEEYSNSSISPERQNLFTISSDIDDVTKNVDLLYFADKKLGEFLYDKEYGMGQFGGKWLYNNFNLTLLKRRGKSDNEAVKLRYGYELKDVSIEYSSDNNYNVVVPCGKVIDKYNTGSTDEEQEMYLSGEPYFLTNTEINKYPRLKIVDVSDHLPRLVVNTTNGDGMIDAFNKINSVFRGSYYRGKYKARGYEISVTAELNYNSEVVQGLSLYDSTVLVTKSGKTIQSTVEGIKFDALNERIINVELGNKPLTLHDMIGARRR